MTDADKIESIRRLTLGPDDALIVYCSDPDATQEDLMAVKNLVRRNLGSHVRVLVHGPGTELTVLNIAGQADSAA